VYLTPFGVVVGVWTAVDVAVFGRCVVSVKEDKEVVGFL